MFSSLTAEQLNLLVRSLERRVVPAGAVLIRQGDQATELYVVESGRFNVTHDRDPSKVLATVERGALLGEIAVQTGGRRTATVVAGNAASVFVLSKELFLGLVSQQKRFAASIDELVRARTGAAVTGDAVAAAAAQTPSAVEPANDGAEVVWREPALPAVRSWAGRFRPFPAVRQQSVMDCGAACITTVCRYYGKHVSLNRMRELSRVEQSGASMRDMHGRAADAGVRGAADAGHARSARPDPAAGDRELARASTGWWSTGSPTRP